MGPRYCGGCEAVSGCHANLACNSPGIRQAELVLVPQNMMFAPCVIQQRPRLLHGLICLNGSHVCICGWNVTVVS